MPYRALTHGRVNNPILDKNGNPFVATTQTQAAAINSQKGVANTGPNTVQKNKNNKSNKQPARYYARTLSINFLMTPDALGPKDTYVSGQGKGFPRATPQTSVGSTNAFTRRAIARRAVTQLAGEASLSTGSRPCPCNPRQVKNLKGQFLQ